MMTTHCVPRHVLHEHEEGSYLDVVASLQAGRVAFFTLISVLITMHGTRNALDDAILRCVHV